MVRYGINPHQTLGIPMPLLRKTAKSMGKNHRLALSLWDSGIHEARILSALIDDPSQVTESQMEKWVNDFDSWDVCDQVCSNLFDKTPFACQKTFEWSRRKHEFVKRAGFVLMAVMAVHDKKAEDNLFESFLPLILKECVDERNFVKKSVNWALRQIGKRNPRLRNKAVQTAKSILHKPSKSARWIASDAMRELVRFTRRPATTRSKGKKIKGNNLS